MRIWFSFFVTWLLRVAAWMSQTVNLFFLFGHHDRTISARCYLNRHRRGWRVAYRVVNAVFRFLLGQQDHCKASHLRDVEFARQVLVSGE